MPYYKPGPTARSNQESTLNWRKSSASGNGADCVEVASCKTSVLVRDSRNKAGTVLKVTAGSWLGFLSRVKNGDVWPSRTSIRYRPAVPEASLPFIASA